MNVPLDGTKRCPVTNQDLYSYLSSTQALRQVTHRLFAGLRFEAELKILIESHLDFPEQRLPERGNAKADVKMYI